jgi:protein-tyrosine phosphatase
MAQPFAAGAAPAPRGPFPIYRICVVCLGNICRSPMAEIILRNELRMAGLADRVTVDSAGTGDWHLGEPMDRGARAELARRGYDGSGHEARQIQANWLRDYALLLAMDRSNLASLQRMAAGQPRLANRIALLRSFDPAAPPDAEVPDPYGGGPDEFAVVFEQVQAAAEALTAQLAELLTDEASEADLC